MGRQVKCCTPKGNASSRNAPLPQTATLNLSPDSRKAGDLTLTPILRYVTFQMAEVAVPSQLFAEILRLIDGLRPPPTPA